MIQAITAYQTAIRSGKVDLDWLAHYKDNDDYTKGHYHRGVCI